MSESVDSAGVDFAKLKRAAKLMGIDVSTLPSRQALDERAREDEPAPLPKLNLKPLGKRQLAALHKAMPPPSRWLSAIRVDEYIEAMRFLAAADFAWTVVPIGEGWTFAALKGRHDRCFRAGVWGRAFQIVDGTIGLFSESDVALFRKLADAESTYHSRLVEQRAARIRKLSKTPPFA